MMTHDPFQNFQTLAAYSGGASPFGVTYPAIQPFLNPLAFAGQPQASPGIGGYGYGTYPQSGSGAGLPGLGMAGHQTPWHQILAMNPLAALQNPFLQYQLAQTPWQNPAQAGLQNPLLQNPLLQHQLAQIPWQNPALAGLQNPLLNPALAYQGWPQQLPFNYPLAPQSLIGGIGQPFSQFHPLAQMAPRPVTGYGY